MPDRMSNERVAELHTRAASTGLRYGEVAELFEEMERLRKLESSLTPEWGYRRRGERGATPTHNENYAREMAERRREVVAHRLRTDWINDES